MLKRAVLLIMVAATSCSLARSRSPDAERHYDAQWFTLEIPEGWQVTRVARRGEPVSAESGDPLRGAEFALVLENEAADFFIVLVDPPATELGWNDGRWMLEAAGRGLRIADELPCTRAQHANASEQSCTSGDRSLDLHAQAPPLIENHDVWFWFGNRERERNVDLTAVRGIVSSFRAKGPFVSSSSRTADDPLERFQGIRGLKVESSTFDDAQGVFGRSQVHDNGEDAGDHACAVCYVGEDGTVLVLGSHGEMNGCSEIGWFDLVARADVWEDRTRRFQRDKVLATCAPSETLSRAVATDGGLRLGMTQAEVSRLLGKPKYVRESEWSYSATVPVPGDGEFATQRGVGIRFKNDRVIQITADKLTSG